MRLVIILATVAIVALLGGRTYHFIFRPEWTEPQALRELWFVWALGLAALVGSCGALGWQAGAKHRK